MPAPPVNVRRRAGLDRDRADAHVAAIDMPAFVARLTISTAGEGGQIVLHRATIAQEQDMNKCP
jgi:hypothetical protein